MHMNVHAIKWCVHRRKCAIKSFPSGRQTHSPNIWACTLRSEHKRTHPHTSSPADPMPQRWESPSTDTSRPGGRCGVFWVFLYDCATAVTKLLVCWCTSDPESAALAIDTVRFPCLHPPSRLVLFICLRLWCDFNNRQAPCALPCGSKPSSLDVLVSWHVDTPLYNGLAGVQPRDYFDPFPPNDMRILDNDGSDA